MFYQRIPIDVYFFNRLVDWQTATVRLNNREITRSGPNWPPGGDCFEEDKMDNMDILDRHEFNSKKDSTWQELISVGYIQLQALGVTSVGTG